MYKAACNVTDDRLQMVVMRDPRPTVVSYYYHHIRFNTGVRLGTVDEFVENMLPSICQWVAIRHILFDGLMADRAAFFWYERANTHPVEWHSRWYTFIGLKLPTSTVQVAATYAVMMTKNLNGHPGGVEATLDRTYRDEVDPALLEKIDEILRVWLPPALLAKLGMSA